MNPPDEASVMMLQRMLAQLSGGGGGLGFGMPGENSLDGDGGGPSLQDFMSPDASFLHDLRQRREGAMEDFVAFELYVDEEGKGGEAATGMWWCVCGCRGALHCATGQKKSLKYRTHTYTHHSPAHSPIPTRTTKNKQRNK